MPEHALRISPDLALPLNAVTSTLVVYGGKGMGKTNFGSVEAEELAAAGLRFSVLDPLGVWWGLRHSADGKKPGIPVLILGGIHGDIPIEPTGGAIVADLVVDEAVNVIIDISRRVNGAMWSHGERIRFVADYCTRLFERQGEQRRPIHQIVDEAGRLVPEQIPSGALDLARCVGAIEQLVEWGRNVGVGVTLITQRSARMKKSVSELADCMVAFRTVGPRSIDAILDWFGEHIPKERWRELVDILRQLPVGTALVVSPGWVGFEGVAHIRLRRTFDSSATPEPGSEPREPTGKAAKPDLTKYQALMAATIEKAKADDPRELRKRIGELERQLSQRPTETKVETKLERVEVPVVSDAQLAQLERFAGDFDQLAKVFARSTQALVDAVQSARSPVSQPGEKNSDYIPKQPVPRIDPIPQAHKRPITANTLAPRPKDSVRNIEGISGPQQRILDALASFEAAGLREVARSNVAVFAGQSSSSSGFANNLGALRSRGLINYPSGGQVALTDTGRAAAAAVEPIRSLEELHEAWRAKLSRPQWAILEPLIRMYPDALTRAQLADLAGQSATSSGYANNLGSLRSLGLIDYPSQGMVAATDLLFSDLPASSATPRGVASAGGRQ